MNKFSRRDKTQGEVRLLYRSEENRIIAGVAGGLGEYFRFEPTIIRIIFILITIFGGWGLLIYIALWILLPNKSNLNQKPSDHINSNVEELRMRAQEFASELRSTTSANRPRFWVGIVLILFGFLFLMGTLNVFKTVDFARIWPILLVILGIMILIRRN